MPKKKVVKMELIGIVPVLGGFKLLGRVEGHPTVIDGNRAMSTNIQRITTENTIYDLTNAGPTVHVSFFDVLNQAEGVVLPLKGE